MIFSGFLFVLLSATAAAASELIELDNLNDLNYRCDGLNFVANLTLDTNPLFLAHSNLYGSIICSQPWGAVFVEVSERSEL